MKIAKPFKQLVPLASALRWRAGQGFIFEEKMDGVFEAREFSDSVGDYILAGERMADGSYFAFDCLARDNRDLRSEPLRDRLNVLDGLNLAECGIFRPARGNGGEFLEAVLAAGGEGIVCKDLSAPYGGMLAAKRQIEVPARLGLPLPGKSSFAISCPETGRDLGHVSAPGVKFYALKPGQIVMVRGFGFTARGLIREPRLAS